MDLITILIYAVAAIMVGAVVAIYRALTKEKRELPLPNETDYGIYWILLPDGIEKGRLTTARKTVERQFETAISNCDSPSMKEKLQKTRDNVLKLHLFAFKGSGKYMISSNRNLIDEKLSYGIGRDERYLVPPSAIVDRGEHDGFHVVHLEMPDPDKVGLTPVQRETLDQHLDALKYIRSTALNLDKEKQLQDRITQLEDTNKTLVDEVAKQTARADENEIAASAKSFLVEETPKLKGPLRARIEEMWPRILASIVVGGVVYAIWRYARGPSDPIIGAGIFGVALFLLYPHIAKRL